MKERKFKTNDYVVVKNWDELVEEYGLVDPESVREQMRNDEDCYWSEEEINEYNPEIINVPWGARKAMIDELVTMGLMKVKEYGEDESVQLESDTYIDSIIPEEILQPVSEDEVKNYIFWLNKKDDDFVMQDYDFTRANGLLSYVGLVNGSIDFIGGNKGNELIAYFYAASILRSIDFNEGVTEYLSHCHEVGVHAFDHFYTDRKSHLQVVAIKDVSEDREEELVNMWAERGWEEVEFHNDKVFKVLTHPEQKGTTIFLNGEKEDYKKDFEAYELIMQIVSHVYGDTMQDVLEVVSNRDRSEAMNMIRDIFSEADKQYVKIKNKINIENFLKVASKGQQKHLEREVQNNQDRVNSYKDNLRHSLKTLRESQERLFGYLHMKDDSQFNEVREMLNMMGDDLSDFRPGLKALEELNIISPLKECGLTKDDIRQLSKDMELNTHNKPAFACLATRIPYGTKITKELLKKIEKSEEYLISVRFKQFRVRAHNDIARIEVGKDEIHKFFNEDLLNKTNKKLKEIGFKYVTLDMAGYEMGSMNK